MMTSASGNVRSHGRHVPGFVLGAWLAAVLLAVVLLAACGEQAPERAERSAVERAEGSSMRDEVREQQTADDRPGEGAEDTTDHAAEEAAGGPGDEQAGETGSTDDPRAAPIAEPAQVSIPAIGVTSDLLNLGTDDDGRMEVPQGDEFDTAGWYRLGPRPGENGPAIVAGHVDSTDGPSVFFELDQLVAGDEIDITDHDGVTRRFVVDRTEQYAKDEFPTDEVYGDTEGAELRLITCGGPFDQAESSYDDNVVVYAS
ncbi:hypothetical protein BH23ACT2_BH23ACT2_26000 [soil metagenome]